MSVQIMVLLFNVNNLTYQFANRTGLLKKLQPW